MQGPGRSDGVRDTCSHMSHASLGLEDPVSLALPGTAWLPSFLSAFSTCCTHCIALVKKKFIKSFSGFTAEAEVVGDWLVRGLIFFASVSKVCGFLEGREWLVFCFFGGICGLFTFVFSALSLGSSLISLSPGRCVCFLEAFVPTSQPDPKECKTAGE